METISAALEQWKQTVESLKGRKRPRTNPSLMRRYASVLEEVFTDPAAPLDQILPDLHLLPSGVVGMAFGAAAGRLTPERQHAISIWISKQDRGDLERAYTLHGLLKSVPSEAFEMLSSMRTSPNPNKDRRERIASEVAGIPAQSFARMFSDQKEYQIRKVVVLLLLAAQEAKADLETRVAILEGVIPITAKLSLHRGSFGIELRKHIEAVLRGLDGPSLNYLREALHDSAPDAVHDLLGEGTPSVEPRPEPRHGVLLPGPESTPEPLEPASIQMTEKPVLPNKPDPLAWFDANIQMLAHAREFYLAARTEADLERKRREEAEYKVSEQAQLAAKLSRMEAQLRDLEQKLAAAMQVGEASTAKLKIMRQELEAEQLVRQTRERELEEAKEAFNQERGSLQRRIMTNAEARVRDYQIAIAAAVKPLLLDIPQPGHERAAELGPSLLVCIDQIIRTLSDKGVELGRTFGERQ